MDGFVQCAFNGICFQHGLIIVLVSFFEIIDAVISVRAIHLGICISLSTDIITFYVPLKVSVSHIFYHFTQAECEYMWAVVVNIF